MTKEYQKWKSDIKSISNACRDINHKLNHIIEQTGQIYVALACLDDLKSFVSKKDYGYYNGVESDDVN